MGIFKIQQVLEATSFYCTSDIVLDVIDLRFLLVLVAATGDSDERNLKGLGRVFTSVFSI